METVSMRRMKVAMAMVMLVVMSSQVQRSMQLPWNHPLRRKVDLINQKDGPFIGLVMAFPMEEIVLQASGYFNVSTSIELNGRTFYVGTVKGVPSVYVMTGEQIANAAMVMQMLFDTFDIIGVVHYGIAGATNASLSVADVVIPDYVAYSNSWHWTNNETAKGEGPIMGFGYFNLPEPGNNLLGQIEFTPIEAYSSRTTAGGGGVKGTMQKLFWIPVDPVWYELSLQLKEVELEQCINSTGTPLCMPEKPLSHFGLKSSTSNVYLANVAFRDFTYNKFNFSTADEETASVVQTAFSNEKPCIVFRGISDLGGATTSSVSETSGDDKLLPLPPASNISLKTLAAANALELAVEFIELIGTADGKLIRMANQ